MQERNWQRFIPERLRVWYLERKLFGKFLFLERMMKEFGVEGGKKRFVIYYPDTDPDWLLNHFSM